MILFFSLLCVFPVLEPVCCSPEPLDFVQAMQEGWSYEATFIWDEKGHALDVVVQNPGPARALRLEAGLMFQGPDDIQPPVVMEDLLVQVGSGETRFRVPGIGCGNADLASADHGMVFHRGLRPLSEELGRILDRMNAGPEGLREGRQDMVWVYTNGHYVSSVFVPDPADEVLNLILGEEMEGWADPGYAVQYREPGEDDEGRFTGEATEIRCDISLFMDRHENVRVVMVQPDGERIEMMGGVDMGTGRHDLTLTMAFEGYPPGVYHLRIEGERSEVAHFEREVTLQGRG